MSGQDDPGLATLSPDSRLLRTFDLGAVAFRALAAERPLAILIDDLQWSDEDSLRLLRYVVRTDGASPIFLMFAIRPEEFAVVTEAVNLVADMGRVGVVRRLKLDRFSQTDTREFLAQVLGGPVDPSGAAVMHAQAEGVPFIVEEMAFAYREGGLVQEIDGVWTLAGNAERLVPSAVKTLISRRAMKLPDDTKALLAVAAILGRRFSLEDLREVQLGVDGAAPEPEELAEILTPAVTAGLLVEHEEESAADYSFQHEQVREFAAATLTSAARRSIHKAIVTLLMSGEPSAGSLPLIARHAKAAGDGAVCVRFSVEASKNALAANAPEEVLRVVELALPSASTPEQRVGLLDARDQALDMLRRPGDRMQGLAELAALAEALGDARLGIDVRLRRAAAMRTAEEFDRAAEIAREVRDMAVEEGDREGELAACMELGQDLLRATAGESFTPSAVRGRSRRRRAKRSDVPWSWRSSSATSRARQPRRVSSVWWSSAVCARGSSTRSSRACTSRSRNAWRPARSWRTSCRSWRSPLRSWRRSGCSSVRWGSTSSSVTGAARCPRSSRSPT